MDQVKSNETGTQGTVRYLQQMVPVHIVRIREKLALVIFKSKVPQKTKYGWLRVHQSIIISFTERHGEFQLVQFDP